MTNFLILIILTSLTIEGVTIVTSEGFLLYPLRRWFDKHFEGFVLHKPLLGCHICMASIWGTGGFMVGVLLYGFSIWLWPVFCLCVAALNSFLYKEL